MTNTIETENISRFLSVPITNYFLTKLEEFNAIFGQQQVENIHYTITLIDNKSSQEKIENMIKSNIQKSTQWCIKHNVPHNNFTTLSYTPENVFT